MFIVFSLVEIFRILVLEFITMFIKLIFRFGYFLFSDLCIELFILLGRGGVRKILELSDGFF